MLNTMRVREFMEKKHMNQEELADAVGVAQPTMSYILRGLKDPSYRTVVNIAKALECSIDEITIK